MPRSRPYRTSGEGGSHPKMEEELGLAGSTQQPAPVGEPRKVEVTRTWQGQWQPHCVHCSCCDVSTPGSPALLALLKASQDPFNKFLFCYNLPELISVSCNQVQCSMDKQQGPKVWHRELYSISCHTVTEKNMKMNIYIKLNYCAVQQKLTQHCKSIIHQ